MNMEEGKEDLSLHSDINTFKATFQKPSNIYKYLRERWKDRPFYLHRNLSYINKHRQQIIFARTTSIELLSKILQKRIQNNRKGNRYTDNYNINNNNSVSTLCLNGILDQQNGNKFCFFNWICNDSVRQMTKSKGFICPWCDKDFHYLDSLMMHLRCCHPRFNFSLMERNDETIINVAINHSYDGSYHGFKYPGHDLKKDFKFCTDYPTRRYAKTKIFFFRARKRPYNDNALHMGNNYTNNDYYHDSEVDADCAGRLYYHTTTCLPIKPKEVDLDSEADTDPLWLRQRTQLMIDEFTDVNEGEKEVLKMWNLHLMENYQYTADHMMSKACMDFVDKEGIQIISKNLFKNFTLHLVNLYNFGLLSSMDILNCVRKLRKIKPHQQSQQQNQLSNSNANSNRNILNVKPLMNGLSTHKAI